MKNFNFFKLKWLLLPFVLLTLGVGQMWGATTTYTFSNASWNASPANWTSYTNGSDFESASPYRGVRCGADVNGSCASPTSFSGVVSIEVVASSNTTGSQITISIGSTEIATKDIVNSNNVTYTYNSSDYAAITGLSGNIKMDITAPTTKSVYVKSVSITYVTETFTITYNAGSGSCGTASKTQDKIGETLTLPSASPNSDCNSAGWVFAGWATASCTETTEKPTLYTAGSSYIPVSSHTLYAVYQLGDVYAIDFENAANTYTNWTFTNITSQQTNANVLAHSGSYIGLTANTSSYQTIVTNAALSNPQYITFYVSKTSTNTTTSAWKIYVSADGSDWGDAIKEQDATSMSKGEWVEVTQDLSSYSNVYVKVEYGTNNAIRAIDDLELSCAIYNSNPDCTVDHFIDIMHDNETIEKQGTYSAPAALSDATPGEDYCDEKHYHFLGWIEEQYVDEDGTLNDASKLKLPGDEITADNKTFYAVWVKIE